MVMIVTARCASNRETRLNTDWRAGSESPALFLSHFMPLALTWFVLDIFLEQPERRELGRGPMALSVLVVAFLWTLNTVS